jgi:hypothetical protein
VASLALQSATGVDIPNEQDSAVDDAEFERFLVKFERDWKSVGCVLRPSVVIRYNCHGFTFASRRTWIDDSALVPKILFEDGFEQIKKTLDVLPGDVVVYFDQNGKAEHSGIVVEAPSSGTGLGIPRVVSKWAKAHEVVHWANQCPYSVADVRYYRVTRPTTKPNEQQRRIAIS